MFEGAHRTLGQFLLPLTVDDFLDKTLIGGFQKIEGSGRVLRTGLLGVAPSELLLQAVHLAPKLTFHSANPSGAPPALESISDASVFRRSIDQLHAGNYSVRFPDLRPLSQPLDILARAIEVLLHQPVTASAFWSRSGMKSPVHHDDHDLIAVQIRGSKRWYIASGPSELNNTWSGIPRAASPELGNHTAVDMQPGDLLYVPRGTLHSVASESESLHVAIGFAPLTVRAAVLAALDHLSDLDQRLRMTIGGPHAAQLHGKGFDKIAASIADGAVRLASACRIPGFLAAALQMRSSRTVASLKALPKPSPVPSISLDTIVVRKWTSFCHLIANAQNIDVSYPGGHIYVHIGAQESIFFIANTLKFRVRDIPGAIDDNVRLSLATKFLEVGFLETHSG